jgi:nitroreductase
VAQSLPAIALPKPETKGAKSLLEALSLRKTSRDLGEEKLSPQMLSNLLWAAFGVNRIESGGRTAPSAMGVKEMDVYVFLAEGIYLYDAAGHTLKPVLPGDHRSKTGTQAGVGRAPLSLLYVADLEKYGAARGMRIEPATQIAWSNAHAGFIGQNVYLYAASEGLGAWFRAMVDVPALTALLNLRPMQKVMYSQSVGYPAKSA